MKNENFLFLIAIVSLSILPNLLPGPSYAESYAGLFAPAGREGDDWDCRSVGQDKGAIEITESHIIGPDISCELSPTSYPAVKYFLSEYGGQQLDVKCANSLHPSSITMARWKSYDTQGVYVSGRIDNSQTNYRQLRQCNSSIEISTTDNNFKEVLVGERGQYWFTPYPLGNNLTELIFQSQSVLNQINPLMWEQSRSSTRQIDELLNTLPENSQLQVSGYSNNNIVNRTIAEAVPFSQRASYVLNRSTSANIRDVMVSLSGEYSVVVTEGGDFEGLICYVEQETTRLDVIPAVSETYTLYGIPEIKKSAIGSQAEQLTPLCTAVYASSINEPIMQNWTGYNHYTTFKVFIDKNLSLNEAYAGDLLFLNGTLRQINRDGIVIEFSEAQTIGEEIIEPYSYNNEPEFK